jgi:hypothetical protein
LAAARRAGEEFGAMFLLPDRRATVAYDIASQVVREGDYDRQRTIFDAIERGVLQYNGQPISEMNQYDAVMRIAFGDISRLPDVFIVRSWHEADAQRALRGYARPNVVRWYPQRDVGVWHASTRRRYVVIWAPEVSGQRAAMHTFALHALHAELVVVCSDGVGPSTRAHYVRASSAETCDVLSGAICVVDATIDDPSWTQALSARGLSVAASTTGGAWEVAEGIALFEPWSHKSIWNATLEAMSRPDSRARESPPSAESITRLIEAARPVFVAEKPLVSVVIPTYNRRDDLTRIIKKLTQQWYQNLEIFVVNDGGEKVSDLASLDSRVVVFDREINVGIAKALNFGLAHIKGKYVATLADDDELYPDHFIRLVGALERTGAKVAHSNLIIRYEGTRNGVTQTTGYNCSVFCHPVDRTEVYAASPVAGHALLIRVDIFEQAGPFNEELILTDQEMQIRLSELSDFVHVPHVTGEWLIRESKEYQFSRRSMKDVPGDMKRMFELHPVAGRPYVAAVREATMRNVSARPPGYVFPPLISLTLPEDAVMKS